MREPAYYVTAPSEIIETPALNQLEGLIDAHGLNALMVALVTICSDKGRKARISGHPSTGRAWDQAGQALYVAARTTSVNRVSQLPIRGRG